MRVLRLRAAVLLLSAPGGTPSDVARTVGYGSLDAMGRAFRDAQAAGAERRAGSRALTANQIVAEPLRRVT